MTQEEILRRNLLIAEFKGFEQDVMLKYHYDWNWLMPVIERIEAIRDEQYGQFYVTIVMNETFIHSKYYLTGMDRPTYQSDRLQDFPTKLESTFYVVSEFIEWYNQNLEK